ncbi:MAG: hypothetical protein ACK5IJ_11275 [Mangrovibacterium sp.]
MRKQIINAMEQILDKYVNPFTDFGWKTKKSASKAQQWTVSY